MTWVEEAEQARAAVEVERQAQSAFTGQEVMAGAIDCPVCKRGNLMWIVLPSGGMSMECSNPTCISWSDG